MAQAVGSLSGLPLAKALRGHLPTRVDVPRARHTTDTAENRFVLGFLDQLEDVVERVAALARSRSLVEHIRKMVGHSARTF